MSLGMHYIIRYMCEMQCVVYAVVLQYCCSVGLLLQPANHSLWLCDIGIEHKLLWYVVYAVSSIV